MEEDISHYFNILINDFVLAKDNGIMSVRISYKKNSTDSRMGYINIMHIIYNDSSHSLKSSEVFLKAFKDRLRERRLSLDNLCYVHFHLQ